MESQKRSSLVYFERYNEANAAYDRAREIGLPQRMFRYQFGPFIANFQSNRIDDLLALTEYALERTQMSDEYWLWHGGALYRKNDTTGAIKDWRKALIIRSRYEDALYALNFVGAPAKPLLYILHSFDGQPISNRRCFAFTNQFAGFHEFSK